jgi:hypothetical protein
MEKVLLVDERRYIEENQFVELVVWQLPQPVRGSNHTFKYRLAFVVDGRCVLRYDNEAGKGDHRHIGRIETSYIFTTAEQLYADFMADVFRLGNLK